MGRNNNNTRVFIDNPSVGLTVVAARDTLRDTWVAARRYRFQYGGRIVVATDEQQPVSRPGHEFFVSAVSREKTVLVRGPYADHASALADVRSVRRRHTRGYPTEMTDRWSWGTVSRPTGRTDPRYVVEPVPTT